jgi:hypothetical protein
MKPCSDASYGDGSYGVELVGGGGFGHGECGGYGCRKRQGREGFRQELTGEAHGGPAVA